MAYIQTVTPQEILQRANILVKQLAQEAAQADHLRVMPFDAMAQLRTLRLGALRIPRIYGGAEGTWEDVANLFVILARGDSSIAQAFLSHYVFVERVHLMGSAAQWQQFFPLGANGTLFGGAAAERGGKFRGEMGSRVTFLDGEYRLNGVKHYSTGALFADILKIRALNDDDRLVSVLVPANREGIERIDDWDGMGQRGTASGTTVLKDVLVYPEEILMMSTWTGQRHHTGACAQIIHSAIDTGIALAACDDAVAFVRKFPELGDNALILHTLGKMSAKAHAAEALVLRAGQLLEEAARTRFLIRPSASEIHPEVDDTALAASLATAHAKIISTEASLDASNWLLDIEGTANTPAEDGFGNFERHWRNARTHTTHDPVAYKCRTIGDFLLNEKKPPLIFSY